MEQADEQLGLASQTLISAMREMAGETQLLGWTVNTLLAGTIYRCPDDGANRKSGPGVRGVLGRPWLRVRSHAEEDKVRMGPGVPMVIRASQGGCAMCPKKAALLQGPPKPTRHSQAYLDPPSL